MVIPYDSDSESLNSLTRIPKTTKSVLPFRPLVQPLTQKTNYNHTCPASEWRSHEAPSSVTVELSVPSPATSTCSASSGHGQDIFTEPESTGSTAPSSPRTPYPKRELWDHPIALHPQNAARPEMEPSEFIPKVDELAPVQQGCRVPKLPGVRNIFPELEPKPRPGCPPEISSSNHSLPLKPKLESPTTSYVHIPTVRDVPAKTNRIDFSQTYNCVSWPPSDYITSFLNGGRPAWQVELATPSGLPSKFDTQDLLVNALDIRMWLARRQQERRKAEAERRNIGKPVYVQSKGRGLHHVVPGHHYGALSQVQHGAITKTPRKQPHCNKKYTMTELHFVRYHIMDLKMSWDHVTDIFEIEFPDPDHKRERQGLQGSYYRANKIIRKLDLHTNQLCFREDGHIAVENMPVRTQTNFENKHYWTLVNLWPECAVKYPWVTPEHRQLAAELCRLPLSRRNVVA
ncbi:uncharacterized protein BCR38DRAFT_100406 [Pseudomassariella vexata]|uniref:Uncharacterized protein n=1 Tax=Pseudomassariella vexata TaxID=1141098 RepID=A0A1Y2EEZ2_9PEZI|nr:uncharacterized protein BCR38DRAFT_100406 [Pseudomassariella vexata]ORY70130.1 hypothetical protein BCR38DRAFT_100406 [Pseudomassariella vexata]